MPILREALRQSTSGPAAERDAEMRRRLEESARHDIGLEVARQALHERTRVLNAADAREDDGSRLRKHGVEVGPGREELAAPARPLAVRIRRARAASRSSIEKASTDRRSAGNAPDPSTMSLARRTASATSGAAIAQPQRRPARP